MRSAKAKATRETNPEFDGVDNEVFGYVDFATHQKGNDWTISVSKNDGVIAEKTLGDESQTRGLDYAYDIAIDFARAAAETYSGRKIDKDDYFIILQESSGHPTQSNNHSTHRWRYRFGWL